MDNPFFHGKYYITNRSCDFLGDTIIKRGLVLLSFLLLTFSTGYAAYVNCINCHKEPEKIHPSVNIELCARCHSIEGKFGKNEIHVIHRPKVDCTTCHGTMPTIIEKPVCEKCHTSLVEAHEVLVKEKRVEKTCDACHKKEAPKIHHALDIARECQRCHEKQFIEKAHTLKEQCKDCHLSNNLIKIHENKADCFSCHKLPPRKPACSECHAVTNHLYDPICEECHVEEQYRGESVDKGIRVHNPHAYKVDCWDCHIIPLPDKNCTICHVIKKDAKTIHDVHKEAPIKEICDKCHKKRELREAKASQKARTSVSLTKDKIFRFILYAISNLT